MNSATNETKWGELVRSFGASPSLEEEEEEDNHCDKYDNDGGNSLGFIVELWEAERESEMTQMCA